ncbi:MAG: hypothetical protein ABUK01_05825 [Leptospirales bacterium]
MKKVQIIIWYAFKKFGWSFILILISFTFIIFVIMIRQIFSNWFLGLSKVKKYFFLQIIIILGIELFHTALEIQSLEHPGINPGPMPLSSPDVTYFLLHWIPNFIIFLFSLLTLNIEVLKTYKLYIFIHLLPSVVLIFPHKKNLKQIEQIKK